MTAKLSHPGSSRGRETKLLDLIQAQVGAQLKQDPLRVCQELIMLGLEPSGSVRHRLLITAQSAVYLLDRLRLAQKCRGHLQKGNRLLNLCEILPGLEVGRFRK